MVTLALLVAIPAAAVLVRQARAGLRRLVLPLALSYGVAALLVSPLAYFIVTSSQKTPNPGASAFSGDLLNFVVPTRASVGGWWTGGPASHFPGNDIERGAYLGVPLLLILVWYWLANRRKPVARFLLVLFLAAAVATLGSWLTVDGHRVARLPWTVVAGHRLFVNIWGLPVRFCVFCALLAAVIAAVWLAANRRSLLRVLLAAAAIVTLVPNLSWGAWSRRPQVPVLFTSGTYRQCIPRNSNVIVFPVGPRGDSMIWQAVSGFWFRIAGGYIAPTVPPSFTHPPSIQHLTTADNPNEVTVEAVRELAHLKGATLAIVDAHVASTWRPTLRPLGRPRQAGGALLYGLAGRSVPAACAAD